MAARRSRRSLLITRSTGMTLIYPGAITVCGHAAEADRRMQVMPMAEEITDPDCFCDASTRITTRQHHGIRAETVLFGYGFDLKSTAVRKNLMGHFRCFNRLSLFPIFQPH